MASLPRSRTYFRPRSADHHPATRDFEGDATDGGDLSRRHLPRPPAGVDVYGEEALRELDDKVQQLR